MHQTVQQRGGQGAMMHQTPNVPFTPIKPWGGGGMHASCASDLHAVVNNNKAVEPPRMPTIEAEVMERMEKNLADRTADWSLRVKCLQARTPSQHPEPPLIGDYPLP